MELGIDLGTGSVKVALFRDGHGVREASVPYGVQAPQPGWAETDPAGWWAATVRAVREVVGDQAPEVRAIGLSGQMHGVVLTGSGGAPLRPAILWADTRSTRELAAYRALPTDAVADLRNPVTVGMAGPSLLWLRHHEPERYRQARWALQPKDWLRLQLTGRAHAEPSDASGTLLYDLGRDDWNWSVIDQLGLRPELFAPVVASGAVAGGLTPDAARLLGLPSGLPVVAGGADTAVALLGSGLPVGHLQLTVGSGAQVVSRSAGVPPAQPGLHVFRDTRPQGVYRLGAVQNAGVALEWARRTLRCSWPELYALAQSVPDSGGIVFLPYLTGERTPHLDPAARAGWLGMGLDHDARHLACAAFEGVALAIADAAQLMPTPEAPVIRLAGGGSVDLWWRQLLADALAQPLEPVDVANASVYGAAQLASGVTDPWPERPQTVGPVVTPNPERLLAEYRQQFRAAYAALRPWFAPPGT